MGNLLNFRNKSGFTLIEVLIALVTLSFLSMTSIAFIDSIRNEEQKQETLTYRNNESSQFFMQMAQPTYIGALAAYAENKALLNCLESDGVICETGKSYPLVAFDLNTGKPIANLDTGSERYVDTEVSFKIHCPQEKTSCDQLDYLNITVKTRVHGKFGFISEYEKIVTVEPKRTNVLSFIPNTQVKEGAPANILIFVDGSNSMSTIKDSFKNTLTSLIDKIKTMDATVAVYSLNNHTTMVNTDSYILEADGTKTAIATWSDLAGGKVFYNDVDLRLIYTNNSTVFEFTHDMTAADRTTKVQALNAQVDKIFAENSTQKDAPLCGFMRALQDLVDGKSGFSLTEGTPTLVMVLTNEDDESVFSNMNDNLGDPEYSGFVNNPSFVCAKSLTQKWVKDFGTRMYTGKRYYFQYAGEADFSLDGVPARLSSDSMKLMAKYDASLPEGADCTAAMQSSANLSKLESDMKALTGPYSLFPNSTYLGNVKVTSCKVVYVQEGIYTGSTSENHCLNYLETSTYGYIVPGSCSYTDYPTNMTGASSIGTTIKEVYAPNNKPAHDTRDVTVAIHDTLKTHFNIGNFSFAAVINPNSGICPITTGATKGSTYEKLASYSDLKSDIIPICSSSYDSKLLESSDFLQSFSMGNIETPVNTGSRITGVEVVRGSTILMPTAGTDYTLNGDVVNFTTGYLQSTDIVRVYLK